MEFYWQKKSNISVDGPVRLQTWLFSNKYIKNLKKYLKMMKILEMDSSHENVQSPQRLISADF